MTNLEIIASLLYRFNDGKMLKFALKKDGAIYNPVNFEAYRRPFSERAEYELFTDEISRVEHIISKSLVVVNPKYEK